MHNSLLHLLLKNCDFLTDISQGSVATRLGCGGVFKYGFVTNFLLSLNVKKIENRLIFGEFMSKSLVSCFFDSRCSSAAAVEQERSDERQGVRVQHGQHSQPGRLAADSRRRPVSPALHAHSVLHLCRTAQVWVH